MMSPADFGILVLEDEPSVLRLVTAALKNTGFSRLVAAGTIQDARKAISADSHQFNLLLTDFSLPDGPVQPFLEECLRLQPRLSIMLITGFGRELLEFDPVLKRKITFMQKPFRPSDLCAAVKLELERVAEA